MTGFALHICNRNEKRAGKHISMNADVLLMELRQPDQAGLLFFR